LERLRKDKDFQKYVVDEILRRHITELTDITKIGIIGKDTKIGFEERIQAKEKRRRGR
jgi:hypothetical protein